MPLFFTVIPGRPRVGGPDDLLVPTIGNHSQFPSSIVVLPDQDLVLTVRLENQSVLGELRVTTGDDFDIILNETLDAGAWVRITEDGDVRVTEDGDRRITEDWPLGSITVQEAPAEVFLYVENSISSTSVANPGIEVQVAPADEYLYPSQLTNVSVLGALTVEAEAVNTGGADDPIVGGRFVGETVP